jgi:hypothetical protein
MIFYSLKDIPNEILDELHTSSTGEQYCLRHFEKLRVEMVFLGRENSNANSQGWERSGVKYFKALYQNCPEMFSKNNIFRIENGQAPLVDETMLKSIPNWKEFKHQTLIHHHIGGDGEVVAIPQNAHKGNGEIHNHEKNAGITKACENFSELCNDLENSKGKTLTQLRSELKDQLSEGNQVKITYSEGNRKINHQLNNDTRFKKWEINVIPLSEIRNRIFSISIETRSLSHKFVISSQEIEKLAYHLASITKGNQNGVEASSLLIKASDSLNNASYALSVLTNHFEDYLNYLDK